MLSSIITVAGSIGTVYAVYQYKLESTRDASDTQIQDAEEGIAMLVTAPPSPQPLAVEFRRNLNRQQPRISLIVTAPTSVDLASILESEADQEVELVPVIAEEKKAEVKVVEQVVKLPRQRSTTPPPVETPRVLPSAPVKPHSRVNTMISKAPQAAPSTPVKLRSRASTIVAEAPVKPRPRSSTIIAAAEADSPTKSRSRSSTLTSTSTPIKSRTRAGTISAETPVKPRSRSSTIIASAELESPTKPRSRSSTLISSAPVVKSCPLPTPPNITVSADPFGSSPIAIVRTPSESSASSSESEASLSDAEPSTPPKSGPGSPWKGNNGWSFTQALKVTPPPPQLSLTTPDDEQDVPFYPSAVDLYGSGSSDDYTLFAPSNKHTSGIDYFSLTRDRSGSVSSNGTASSGSSPITPGWSIREGSWPSRKEEEATPTKARGGDEWGTFRRKTFASRMMTPKADKTPTKSTRRAAFISDDPFGFYFPSHSSTPQKCPVAPLPIPDDPFGFVSSCRSTREPTAYRIEATSIVITPPSSRIRPSRDVFGFASSSPFIATSTPKSGQRAASPSRSYAIAEEDEWCPPSPPRSFQSRIAGVQRNVW